MEEVKKRDIHKLLLGVTRAGCGVGELIAALYFTIRRDVQFAALLYVAAVITLAMALDDFHTWRKDAGDGSRMR